MSVVLLDIRETPLSVDEVLGAVRHPGAGAIDLFLGVVRDRNDGHGVTRLEYEAYVPMARAELRKLASEISAEMPEVRIAAVHRLGSLAVGEIAVVCAASSPHRSESFTACRALIERIKERVPVWKRELGEDGVSWVGWADARCAHGHDHDHGGAR